MALAQMGRKFYVSTDPVVKGISESALEALTYTEVKFVGNFGQTGTEENILTYNTMDTEVADKQKGIANAGDPTLEVAYDANDPGQQLMRAHANTRLTYAFKSELDDAPPGGTPTTFYNVGLVAGPAMPNGGPEDFVVEVYTLPLVQKQIIVPATGP